jgi:hypothetical protein
VPRARDDSSASASASSWGGAKPSTIVETQDEGSDVEDTVAPVVNIGTAETSGQDSLSGFDKEEIEENKRQLASVIKRHARRGVEAPTVARRPYRPGVRSAAPLLSLQEALGGTSRPSKEAKRAGQSNSWAAIAMDDEDDDDVGPADEHSGVLGEGYSPEPVSVALAGGQLLDEDALEEQAAMVVEVSDTSPVCSRCFYRFGDSLSMSPWPSCQRNRCSGRFISATDRVTPRAPRQARSRGVCEGRWFSAPSPCFSR